MQINKTEKVVRVLIKTAVPLNGRQKAILIKYVLKELNLFNIPIDFDVDKKLSDGIQIILFESKPRIINFNLQQLTKDLFSYGLINSTEKILDKKQIEEITQMSLNQGIVESVADGIAIVTGLKNIKYGEMVKLPESNLFGVVLDLEKDRANIMVFGEIENVLPGHSVLSQQKQLSIKVSESIIGRHVNALGLPKDGKSLVHKNPQEMLLHKQAPGVMKRRSVNEPVYTGIKTIDAMIPIGRGQRELIIGDRKTGKTTLAIDTILNQKGQDVICIYVAIGQKTSSLVRIHNVLKLHNAMEYTILVSEDASSAASMQYLAPYTGMAIAEYFLEQGRDVLIVFDDLTRHAWAYREISLLQKRPPGREAYPGDIFYLHASLLERACKLDDKYGGGSITALPIVETQAGDVSAYIPTNIISITDGQIYLEKDLFNHGIKPAINIGLSVSRVGSVVQPVMMKQISGDLRLKIAQFNELVAFTQFGTELNLSTQKTIERGKRLTKLLNQNKHDLFSVIEEVIILFAGVEGFLDDLNEEKIEAWEQFFRKELQTKYSKVLKEIKPNKKIDKKIKETISKIIKNSIEEFTLISDGITDE